MRIEIDFPKLCREDLTTIHEISRTWIPLGNPILTRLASALFLELSRRSAGEQPGPHFVDVESEWNEQGLAHLQDAFQAFDFAILILKRLGCVDGILFLAEAIRGLCETIDPIGPAGSNLIH